MSQVVKVGNRQYQLGSVLGVGGFSEVCKGVDMETRKRVALKIMYSDKQRSSSELKQQLIQVQKEIKAMKQLNHPHLIRLLGYDLKCEVKNRKAIVMVQQLAPKGELFDYLMYTKKFEEPQANALFKQLIAGLEAMHKAGIAHRDLKPENVLFDNQFNLKLADFGFAYVFQKGEGAKSSMRTELGTKGYMAPEIINNKKYTEKADIFAAGVILFIMLAGFPPFQNAVAKDWWFDKLMKSKYKLFWMAHERTAKFSKEAKSILQEMLAPKEADRHDVKSVQTTAFWNKKALTKDEIRECLKKRKLVVDEEKLKEPKDGRDTLLQILIPKDDLLPESSPILLSSLLNNKHVEKLRGIESRKDLELALVDMTESEVAQKDLREKVKSLEDVQASELAKTLASSAKLTPDELIDTLLKDHGVKIEEQLAKIISENLKLSEIGKIDDYGVVETFAKLEESTKIPVYDVLTEKTNSYRTKMSFGLLGYCLSKFWQDRGKLQIDNRNASVLMKCTVQKKVCLPKEGEDDTIGWVTAQMPIHIQIKVQLAYDKKEKINVVTFENISKNHMGMREYTAIVKEITENHNWLLRYFLEGNFTRKEEDLEDTIIGEDYQVEDGDLDGAEEEVNAAKVAVA